MQKIRQLPRWRGLHLGFPIRGNTGCGRRFGDNNQFGARVNLVHREGEGAVDNDKRRTTLASLGLDYKGDRLRSSLDFGYQKKTFHGSRNGVNISGVDFIPAVPGIPRITVKNGATAISKTNSVW